MEIKEYGEYKKIHFEEYKKVWFEECDIHSNDDYKKILDTIKIEFDKLEDINEALPRLHNEANK